VFHTGCAAVPTALAAGGAGGASGEAVLESIVAGVEVDEYSSHRAIVFFDPLTMQEKNGPTVTDKDLDIHALAWSPDGSTLAVSFNRKKKWQLALWDAKTLQPQGQPLEQGDDEDGAPTFLQYSPDGCLLATGGDDGSVKLWEVASGTRSFEERAHTRPVGTVRFSPDGRRLVSGAWDGGVVVWDVASRSRLREFSHEGIVVACRLSPDGLALDVAEKPEGTDRPRIHRLTL
jgi:WD40 repeat protein